MKYSVYVLKSLSNSRFYIGQTENLQKRLKEHNAGKSRATKSGIPWVVLRKEIYDTRSEAIKREKELKHFKKRRYIEIEKIIAG